MTHEVVTGHISSLRQPGGGRGGQAGQGGKAGKGGREGEGGGKGSGGAVRQERQGGCLARATRGSAGPASSGCRAGPASAALSDAGERAAEAGARAEARAQCPWGLGPKGLPKVAQWTGRPMDMAPTPKAAQWTISTSTRRAMRCVEDNAMNSRFTLGSALCFTTMTALHGTGKFTDSPLVTVAQSSALSLSLSPSLPPSLSLAQSSATLFPHTLAGCGPCRGRPARARKRPAESPPHRYPYKSYGSDRQVPRHRSAAFSFITRVRIGPASLPLSQAG